MPEFAHRPMLMYLLSAGIYFSRTGIQMPELRDSFQNLLSSISSPASEIILSGFFLLQCLRTQAVNKSIKSVLSPRHAYTAHPTANYSDIPIYPIISRSVT